MRPGRRPSSDFPDVPRADLPLVCFSRLPVAERRSRGPASEELSFPFGPRSRQVASKECRPRRRALQAGKRGRNNIHAARPKCSRRRFTHGTHETVRVRAKPNTIPNVPGDQTLSSAANETTPGLEDPPSCTDGFMAPLQLRARLSLWFGFFWGSVQASRSSRRAAPDQSRRSMERLKLGPWTRRLVGAVPSEAFCCVQTLLVSRLAAAPLGADQLIGRSLGFSTTRR